MSLRPIAVAICALFPQFAISETLVKLTGTEEGMVQALSASPMQYGCSGTVAVDIPNILFDNDKDSLTSKAELQMDVMARALRDRAFTHDSFVIEGHASAPGSEAHNQDLSERRAQTIKRAMEARKIEAYRLSWRAYGETRLLYPDRPDHADNRRVTVRRVPPSSAQLEALSIDRRNSQSLSYRLMVADPDGAWWATPDDVIDRRTPVYLCVSASRVGLLHVEIREEGKSAFEPVDTWPLPEGGLVRVPDRRDFKFTGTPRWQEIRLRHVDCTRASCPSLSSGVQERLRIDRSSGAPKPVDIRPTTLPDCNRPGVVCEIFKVRHE